MRLLISSLVLLAIVPVTASAQVPVTQPPAASAQQQKPVVEMQKASGPTIEAAAVGIRPAMTTNADASAEAQRRRSSGMSQSVTLMIVGGAAMVAGAIIGDDAGTIFLVGGAVIALYGLYQYLK